MKITITAESVMNSRGVFTRGDQVRWPERTARPVVQTEAAVEGWVDLDEEEEEVDATDAARELADAEGVALATLEGTGEDGRIVKPDVEAAVEADTEDEEG